MSTPARIYRRSELEAIKPAIDADGCLHRYKAIWIDGVDDATDPALIGIAFAAIKHAYILKLVEAGLGQDFELAQDAFIDGTGAAKTPSRLLPDVASLWKFHAEKFELPLERFLLAEERGAGQDVGFTPDLVLAHPETNTLEIVDDKSGWQPPLTEAELKGLFQARVYSRYAKDRWPGFSKYAFTLNAVRFNKAITTVFSPSELDAVELEVKAAIRIIQEAIETNHWPATPGPSCHFCSLCCPVADQIMTLPRRLDLDLLPKLLGWIEVADRQLRAAKKLAKAGVGIHGRMVVNGLTWDLWPSESKAYPIDILIEVLRIRGVMGAFEDAAAKDLAISHSALGKLFAAYPGLEDDLKNYAKTKMSYRFGAKQPGKVNDEDEE